MDGARKAEGHGALTPETIDRWASELHLSTSERRIFAILASRGEATITEMVEALYSDREDGGPLRADHCARQFIHSLRKKLADRATIHTKHLFELELHPGRR